MKQLKLEEADSEKFNENQECVIRALLVIGLKLVDKQLSKMTSKPNGRESEGNKTLKHAMKTSQALDDLFFNFKDPQSTKICEQHLRNFGEELTSLLRNLVHEEDDKLRQKMQKQIERNLEVGKRASAQEEQNGPRKGKKRKSLD